MTGKTYKAILLDHRVSHGAFRMWHILNDHLGKNSSCWPGVRRLRKLLGGSKYESITAWRSELIEAGYVTTRIGRNRVFVYTLLDIHAPDKCSRNGEHSAPEMGNTGAPEMGSETKPIEVNLTTKVPPTSKIISWERKKAELKDEITALEDSTYHRHEKTPEKMNELAELRKKLKKVSRLIDEATGL